MIHDHANHIFDRLTIGIRYWNVHVQYESELQSPIGSADSMGRLKLNTYILVSIKDTIGVVVNRLVGMGL